MDNTTPMIEDIVIEELRQHAVATGTVELIALGGGPRTSRRRRPATRSSCPV